MPFIPDEDAKPGELFVPFFEQSKDAQIAGRGTTKSIEELQTEIRDMMLRLGAGNVQFKSGFWDDLNRFGFRVTFSLNGQEGRMECVALPMQNLTEAKKDRALAQALYWLRDWLEAESNSRLFRLDTIALLPFLVNDQGKTMTEVFVERGGGLFQGLYLPSPK